jgi:hypothetical protein
MNRFSGSYPFNIEGGQAGDHSRSQHHRGKGPLHPSVGLRIRELHVADSGSRLRSAGGHRHSPITRQPDSRQHRTGNTSRSNKRAGNLA